MPEITADVQLSLSRTVQVDAPVDIVNAITLEVHRTETIQAETEGPVTSLEV